MNNPDNVTNLNNLNNASFADTVIHANRLGTGRGRGSSGGGPSSSSAGGPSSSGGGSSSSSSSSSATQGYGGSGPFWGMQEGCLRLRSCLSLRSSRNHERKILLDLLASAAARSDGGVNNSLEVVTDFRMFSRHFQQILRLLHGKLTGDRRMALRIVKSLDFHLNRDKRVGERVRDSTGFLSLSLLNFVGFSSVGSHGCRLWGWLESELAETVTDE